LQAAYNTGNTILTTTSRNIIFTDIAGTQFVVNMDTSVAPTVDIMNIINTGASQGTITTAVDGLQIDFATAGTTASADNAGLRVNITSNNSGATTTLEGIYIGDLNSAEANSTETGLKIGTGWDQGLVIESGGSTNAGLVYSAAGRPTNKIILSAEYPGAVLFADGSDNTGTMTSDYTNAQGTGSRMTYYEWNSSTASPLQDYDVVVRFTLPSNFSAWKDGTDQAIVINYVTEDSSSANNQIDATIRLSTSDSADATEVNMVSTSWTTGAIDDSELNECDAAGETCVIELKIQSMNNFYARVGDIVLQYLAKY